MGSRERGYFWRLNLICGAVAILLVFLDSTPARNYVYSYIDSKGVCHIKNINLEAPSDQSVDRDPAVIRAESGFVPEAVSWKGAMGLMQLMLTTAACLGVRDPFCPQENIMGGCLRDLLNKMNGSAPLSLAAYNAGLQRVIYSGYQIPAITETQDFVEKVLSYFFNYLQQAASGRKI
jgi:hypothetical protein